MIELELNNALFGAVVVELPKRCCGSVFHETGKLSIELEESEGVTNRHLGTLNDGNGMFFRGERSGESFCGTSEFVRAGDRGFSFHFVERI